MTKLSLKAGQTIGDGARSIVIEKITPELIYARLSQNGNSLRYIPVQVVNDLVAAIQENKISLEDISRRYRSDKQLPHLFDELGWDLDKYILGYDATIQKICEYVLSNADSSVFQAPSNETKLSKPFLLLAGISGTGKTRFIREQAKATGSLNETYCLCSVRPDWHEPSDLLGYVSRLGNTPQYIATDVLRFIVKAWREIIESIKRDKTGKPVDWRGRDLADIRPFWLCLDEMNLAPVEQYFADYLSVLETRSWNDPEKLQGSGLDYIYECDPLIKGEVFTALDSGIDAENKPTDVLASDLGFDLSKALDKAIWEYFLHHGISIPFNLIVAGTVNMDETTHGFSRKVIDRALSFDFGEFFPNNFDEFFTPTVEPKILSYPNHSQVSQDDLNDTIDSDGQQSIDFLKAVNAELANTPFQLAYRALNELLLSVVSHRPQNELELKAVWDDFMMCKVLPRIEGDYDKLGQAPSLLESLSGLLREQFGEDIWQGEARPDLYRTFSNASNDSLLISCRSREKLRWMQERLSSVGFTSFWP